MKHADRVLPAIAKHQVVPVGNDVVQRAAGMAERHAAIHAAGALRADVFVGELVIDLEPVVDAFFDGSARGEFAGVF